MEIATGISIIHHVHFRAAYWKMSSPGVASLFPLVRVRHSLIGAAVWVLYVY